MAQQNTWQILPDPPTDDVFDSSIDPVVSPTLRLDSNLFGYGALFPFRRDGNRDFQAAGGGAMIRAEVALILTTTCVSDTTLGELPWRSEFGSLLQQMRLRNNNAELVGAVRQYVISAIARWIPSVSITDVTVVPGRADQLYLRVTYDVVDPTGTQVLVPGLQTQVPIG